MFQIIKHILKSKIKSIYREQISNYDFIYGGKKLSKLQINVVLVKLQSVALLNHDVTVKYHTEKGISYIIFMFQRNKK